MARIIRTAVFALSLLLPVAAFAAQTQYQLRVDGLACPFCAYGIEKELTRTDGVEGIDIDIKAGIVTVTMADVVFTISCVFAVFPGRPTSASAHRDR